MRVSLWNRFKLWVRSFFPKPDTQKPDGYPESGYLASINSLYKHPALATKRPADITKIYEKRWHGEIKAKRNYEKTHYSFERPSVTDRLKDYFLPSMRMR